MAIQFLNQVSADNNVSIAGNLQVTSYIHSDSYLEATQLQLYTGSTTNKFLVAFQSSGNTYINTNTSGETIYFGAPAVNTTNIDVQGTIDCQQYLRVEDTSGSDRLVLRAESTYSTIDNSSNTLNYNAGNHLFLVGLVEKMRISSSGNVGIGTNSPGAKLDVASGDIRLVTNATYLRVKDTASAQPRVLGMNASNTTYIGPIDSYAGGGIVYGASSNVAYHDFYGGGSAKVRITSGGNVGIGTTNPLSTLHVNGTARANDYSVNGAASIFVYSSQLVITNSGNPLYLGGGPGSVAMNVFIPNGNLSVTGTTTTDNLNIGQNGTIDAENSSEILIGSGTEIQIDGDPGTAGQYMKSTGSAVEWATLPDTTKTQTILFSNFIDSGSTTSALRMPFNTLSETSSNQYYNYFDVPSNGTIKRVRMQNTSGNASSGFTTTIVIWKNSSGGSPSYTSSAQTISNSEIEVDPNLSISKGDKVQIAYQKSAAAKYWQGVSATIVIEFTKV